MVLREITFTVTVFALGAFVNADNSTLKMVQLAMDMEPSLLASNERLRREILSDDASISLPDTQLKAFKVDAQKTGSLLGGEQTSGYGGGSYWSGYGADGSPDMQMWPGGQMGATGGMAQGQEQMSGAGYQQGYGQMPGAGAIGTPNSPYAGYLEKQIASYPVMIYTLNECIPCQRAKQLLAVNYPDVRAHYLELSGNEPWQQQLQIDLQYLTGAMTFPYIFVCGQYIGGQSDLFDMHENGSLRRMVQAPNCVKIQPKF
ncbi:Glutaredoxin domain and Thioredoxin-like fold domain-containing protein [Aphelenchoides besseyi]|nr:Glutaredoxin domain and Thioredoxin-like fold domain-containing protein [Aphelenchoides besseyi]KAI6207899.1 Glutaredoxin domain and Thioredoxin-like fold domain-containing protein [Aphelenchoides besseyi]